MQLISNEEITENGNTYIVETYDNGTINKYIKPQETTGELPSQPEPITNEDIMDALQAMQGDQVPAATLDAAYREGVNAVV